MKTSKVTLTVIIVVAALAAGVAGQVPIYGLDSIELENEIGDKPTQFSVGATFLPIIAGIAWWAIDDPDSIYDYDVYGHRRGAYTEDPDRTIPVALIISGLIIGPSAGYFYGGNPERGMKGIILRAGTGMFTMMVAGGVGGSGGGGGIDYSGMAAAFAVGIAGTGAIILEAMHDISKVKENVINNKLEKARQAEAGIRLYPKYFADSGAAGIGLTVNF